GWRIDGLRRQKHGMFSWTGCIRIHGYRHPENGTIRPSGGWQQTEKNAQKGVPAVSHGKNLLSEDPYIRRACFQQIVLNRYIGISRLRALDRPSPSSRTCCAKPVLPAQCEKFAPMISSQQSANLAHLPACSRSF